MGRIRTIKPDFFLHEGLYDLEAECGLPIRLAFAGLWCQADRDGRFKWEPRRLKATILPYDDIDFSRVLDALATRGFVKKYEVNSVIYGHIPGFSDHQVINNREKASSIPKPSENNYLTREPRDDDASSTRAPKNLQEGKGREGKGTSIPVGEATPPTVWDVWIGIVGDTQGHRSFLGKQISKYGDDPVAKAVATLSTKNPKPPDPKAYLIGILESPERQTHKSFPAGSTRGRTLQEDLTDTSWA